MKDYCLDTLFSLGQACVDGEETLTRPCIYIKTVFPICQPPNKKKTPVRGSVRKLVALVHHRDRHHHQHFHHSTGLQR